MTVKWPQDTKHAFNEKLIEASFDPNAYGRFDDAYLSEILDEYPREELGVWTFGDHAEGEAPAIRGEANDLKGKDILEAVKSGHIWLNLRQANHRIPRLKTISDSIFGSLSQASGRKLFKQDMGVLISSPKVHVHYHLDIPMVALFQLRGEKTVWVYPGDETHAPSSAVEDMVHMRKEEGLPFRAEFDDAATKIQLKPGMGLTWPQTAPHRVQNADCLNVSLSGEFMTTAALIRANAIYTNSLIRQRFGKTPPRPDAVTFRNISKAGIARLIKVASRSPRRQSPTPVTFRIDPEAVNCLRIL